MLKRLTVLGTTMFLAVLPVGTAQAATDITLGGSCTLSAHWQLTTSANFNNTSGSPSTGTLDYSVIRSPGELWATNWTAVNANGAVLDSGHFYDPVKQGSDYIYRADPLYGAGTRYVDIQGIAPSRIGCHSKIYAKN